MSRIKTKFITANAVTNPKLAQMAGHTYKGNNTGSTADPADITSTQLTADLNLFSSTLQGLTPLSGGGTTNYLRADGTWSPVGGTVGDIPETSFSAANNQSSPADITGFAFSNAVVRSFDAIISIYINATGSLYAQYKLNGIQKGSSWEMSQSYVGDSTGITFSITTAGQIQYTSTNISGFTSDTMKFRAIILSV